MNIKVIFLHNKLHTNLSKDTQQLYGLFDEIEALLSASTQIDFSVEVDEDGDGKAPDVIEQDMSDIDNGIQQLQYFLTTNPDSRYLIVASGHDGLFTFLRICEKGSIPRHLCRLIWVGTEPERILSNSLLNIDLAILPHWQMGNLDLRKIRSKLMFNTAGILHDWRRRNQSYDPPDHLLSTSIDPDQTRFIGFVIGNHEQFNEALFNFWLEKIIAASCSVKKPYFLVFNAPEMGQDRTYLDIVITYLKNSRTPHMFFDHEEKLNNKSSTQIGLNYIDEHDGEIYITGDLLPLGYNIIQSSRSFTPEVRLLTTTKPIEKPVINPSFVKEKHLDYTEIAILQHKPWLILTPPLLLHDDLLCNSLSSVVGQFLEVSVQKKKESKMAKVCKYLSAPFSMFRKKPTYTAVQTEYPNPMHDHSHIQPL